MAEQGGLTVATVDLDVHGALINHRDALTVTGRAVPPALARLLAVPPNATDIFVFVHGWQTSRERADLAARRLAAGVDELYQTSPGAYPGIKRFHGYFVLVRWPSRSNPLPWGYRRIRDRAHAMTTDGHARLVLSQLLGYLHKERRVPDPSAPVLRNRDGQFLHCVGHSFGGRFLAEAIMAAANPGPKILARRADPRFPYMVDSLLVFQMAARPDDFAGRFSPLLGDSPINGPIVLTHSRHDRALRWWHRMTEHTPGIGAVGVTAPADRISSLVLPHVGERVAVPDDGLVNVDASWRYRKGRFLLVAGAHSDIWYPESMHLLLSVASAARALPAR